MEPQPQIPSGLSDSSVVVEDLLPGVELLAQAVQSADLPLVTWYALHLAERAQFWASHVLNADKARFLSLNGLLCDDSGRIVTLETDELPLLAQAFKEAS